MDTADILVQVIAHSRAVPERCGEMCERVDVGDVGKTIYVGQISADQVIVFHGRRRKRFSSADEAELAEVLTSLRDEGIPLLEVPHGWSPGAVFDSLRERGIVGSYVSVSWAGPGDPILRTDQ